MSSAFKARYNVWKIWTRRYLFAERQWYSYATGVWTLKLFFRTFGFVTGWGLDVSRGNACWDMTWNFALNFGSTCYQSCKKNLNQRTPLLHKFVCFHMLDKGFRPEVFLTFKYFCEKVAPFSKTTLLQRESFLTWFYTINSSLLLITK